MPGYAIPPAWWGHPSSPCYQSSRLVPPPTSKKEPERSISKCLTISGLQEKGVCNCGGKEPWEQLGWARRRCRPPQGPPRAQSRAYRVPWGPYVAGFALQSWVKGTEAVLLNPTARLPGRCPVVLRAVKQRPHVRLVPPGDIDHQHTCKVRGEGQTGPGVTPTVSRPSLGIRAKGDLLLKIGRRKSSALRLEEGGQGVLGSWER